MMYSTIFALEPSLYLRNIELGINSKRSITHPLQVFRRPTCLQERFRLLLVKSCTLLQKHRLKLLLIHSRLVFLKPQKDIHATLHRRTVNTMPISFKLDLIQNCSDEVLLYWRADDVFEKEFKTLLPGFWYIVSFGVDAILKGSSAECSSRDNVIERTMYFNSCPIFVILLTWSSHTCLKAFRSSSPAWAR